MSANFNLNAELRSDMGKGASRRLRREGKIPAILYGTGGEPVSLTMEHNQLIHSLENEAFYSHILTITIDGKDEQAVLKDLQRHPYKPAVLHADFMRVSATEKLRMHVPLHFIGEDVAPGVKQGGGVVSHLINDVEVSCLAKDLPEFIEVDVSAIELNATVHMSDLVLPKGVELVELTHGDDHDQPVVSIHLTRGSVEAVETEEEKADEDKEGGDE